MGMLGSAARAGALAICAGLLTTSLGAATASPSRAPAVQSVVDCRKIEDGAARLACYDKAVGDMVQAEAKGDLVTIDREQRRAVRRSAFGLALPSFSLFDRGEKPEDADKITAKVASASQNALGKWIVKLDDGAMWRQTDDTELLKSPRAGSNAIIRRAALGSFFMSLDGQTPIRAHRDS